MNEPTSSPRITDVAEARALATRARTTLVCRQANDDDFEAMINFLVEGFPERSSNYWRRGLVRLRERVVPERCPRYGYVLTSNDAIVGIVLVIFATTDDGRVRANVSSWYVEGAYRGYSNMLLTAAFRVKHVTFINISPSPSTLKTIAAQGFLPYVGGTFHAIAALARVVPGASVRTIVAATPGTQALLAEHAACGCICIEVFHRGETFPFVFVPARSMRNRFPGAQLVYCRSLVELVRFAGPVGRYLARLGLASIAIDAPGRILGLVGHYAAGRRVKYYRGPTTPRLGDLSSTELVYFGP